MFIKLLKELITNHSKITIDQSRCKSRLFGFVVCSSSGFSPAPQIGSLWKINHLQNAKKKFPGFLPTKLHTYRVHIRCSETFTQITSKLQLENCSSVVRGHSLL